MRLLSMILAIIVYISSMPVVSAENLVMLYASDGRTIWVSENEVEIYKRVSWYENLTDVTVSMYDTDGNIQTVFVDNAQQKLAEGYKYAKSDTTQLMFADDGRVMYIPLTQVEDYCAVGLYRGGGTLDLSRPMVAITYDDGPAKYTDSILDCLEKYGVHATFFVQGKNLYKYPDTLRRIINSGCEIGNHTSAHTKLTTATYWQIKEELAAVNNAVFDITGTYPALFRPPYGAYNSTVLEAAAMPAILWSVDTLDWKTRNAQKTLENIKSSVRDGSIILMHDIHSPTADAAENVIKYLLESGYQLVTVSELLNARKGGAQIGKAYGNGY